MGGVRKILNFHERGPRDETVWKPLAYSLFRGTFVTQELSCVSLNFIRFN
jgi:hypothetical protein